MYFQTIRGLQVENNELVIMVFIVSASVLRVDQQHKDFCGNRREKTSHFRFFQAKYHHMVYRSHFPPLSDTRRSLPHQKNSFVRYVIFSCSSRKYVDLTLLFVCPNTAPHWEMVIKNSWHICLLTHKNISLQKQSLISVIFRIQ